MLRHLFNNATNNKHNVLNITRRMVSSQNNDRINVKVKQGIVSGVKEQLPNGKYYYTFKGIPYAHPPIGELRFMPPKPLDKFPEPIIDCSQERDTCFHKDIITSNFIGSEDCLFLNIYTPKINDIDAKKLPVMVWIHGGAFISGSGNSDYYSPEYIVQENVVVVTFNYRLGPFGFMHLPKAGVYPNAGLKDQLLVLKWIKENILKFHGDPNNVTLFGESAGGASVHIHALSENSKKYFHKAICQSGTVTMEWLLQSDMEGKTKQMAKSLGCTSTDDIEILEFLKNVKESKKIYDTMNLILTPDERRRGLPMIFKPAIEPADSPDAILTKHPLELINEPNKINIPLIIGYNSNEGIIMLLSIYDKKINTINKDLARFIPRSINVHPNDPKCLELAEEIRKNYFDNKEINNEMLPELNNLNTDYHFGIGSQIAAEIHARKQHKSPLYFYRFSFDGEYNFYKKLVLLKLHQIVKSQIKGACHADDVYYLFKLKIFGTEYDESSKSMETLKQMCKMWTNFAKYGNPTPDFDKSLPSKWLPVKNIGNENDVYNLDYLDIGDNIEMKKNPHNDRMIFWRELYKIWNGGFIKPKL